MLLLSDKIRRRDNNRGSFGVRLENVLEEILGNGVVGLEVAENGLEPDVGFGERRPLLGLEFAARDGDFDEVLGTVGLAVLLAEELDVEAEVAGARQVVRVGLYSTDYLAAYDAE